MRVGLRVLVGLDGWPCAKLDVGRGFEVGFEPLARGGVELVEGHFFLYDLVGRI